MTAAPSELYLRKVELSNFRAYGDSFTLDLPPGPGLTLVCGPNGLGKTTLFDGIEWCLTGTISRFNPYVRGNARQRTQHLTRLGAVEGSHRVSLYFSNLEPIDRGRGVAPEEGAIARQLKHPSWPEVGDVARYLSITHFLGQSAAQRFSVKQPKEQWEALRGPAGVDQINQIQDRIGGNATRKAFSRYIERASDELSTARQLVAEWQALTGRVSRLRQLALASRAMSPNGVLKSIQAIAILLQQTAVSEKPVLIGAATPEDAIARARALLVERQELVVAMQRRLSRLDGLVREAHETRSELRRVTDAERAAQERYAELKASEQRSEEEVAAAARKLESTLAASASAESTLITLAQVADAWRNLQAGRERIAQLVPELDLVEVENGSLSARLQELSLSIAQLDQIAERRRIAGERVARLRSATSLVQELGTLAIRDAASEAERVTAELRAVRDLRASLRSEEQRLSADATRVTEQLAAMDRRAAAIAAAATEIAGLLQVDDTTCPVCATMFLPGELVGAVKGATTLSPGMGAQLTGERLASLRVELNRVTQHLVELDNEEAVLDGKMSTLQGTRTRWTLLRQQIGEYVGGTDVPSIEELRGLIQSAEAECDRLDTELSLSETRNALEDSIAENEVRRRALTARAQMLTGERTRLEAATEQNLAALAQRPDLWSDDGLSSAFVQTQSEAARLAAELTGTAEIIRGELSRLKDVSAMIRQETADAAAVQQEYRLRSDALSEQQRKSRLLWIEDGMPGEPDVLALHGIREHLKRIESTMQEAEAQLAAVVAGYRAWRQDEELADDERKVQRFCETLNLSDEHAVIRVLEQRVRDAETTVARATRARQRVDEVVAQLQVEADTYAASVLQPLSVSIAAFADVLMTRGDGSLAYRAEHHSNRPELKPGILRRLSDGSAVSMDMNPNLFFSEGQLSALSVSALLAASTSFRWSRWPALLMDDPLQHNDVIHASAFIDLLLRLVKEARYQVVISTHDTSQADYILRKCKGAEVSHTRCDLPTRSRAGIVSS